MSIKILLPLDDSKTSRRTTEALISQKERFPYPLTLLHVVETDKLAYRMIPDFQVAMVRERAREAGEHFLQQARDQFSAVGLEVETRLEEGSARKIITRIANEEGFQLLIIGRSNSGEIRDVLFGSVTNYVLHNVQCPVLLL